MTQAEKKDQDEPDQPASPEGVTERIRHHHHQRGRSPAEPRHSAMNTFAQQRIHDMTAIELSYRQQVQRRDEQPDPSRERHRMEVNVDRVGIDSENNPRHAPEQNRVSEIQTAGGAIERRDLRQLEAKNDRE